MANMLMSILKFMLGLLMPIVLYGLAAIGAYYYTIFINTSIPFVIGIPLWVGFKQRKKSKAFFIGILAGLCLVCILIAYGFGVISKVVSDSY